MSKNRLLDIPLHVEDRVTTPPTKDGNRRVIKDLDALATLEDSDIIIIQRDNQTYRTTKAILLGGASEDYGSIYTDDGDAASPVITQTPGTTPVLFTGFTDNGVGSGITVDAANDKFSIDITGTYLITAQFAFSGTLNATFELQPTIISDSPVTPLPGTKTERKLGTGGDVGSCSLTGLASLTAGDEVGIYINGTAGADIDTHNAQFTLHRVG